MQEPGMLLVDYFVSNVRVYGRNMGGIKGEMKEAKILYLKAF